MMKRYWDNTGGNMVIIFAVSLMVLMAGVGAAVDFTSMSKKQSQYQNIADAAVLAAARSGETDPALLLAIARNSLLANDDSSLVAGSQLNVSPDGIIQVKLTGSYDTVIMGMFGKPNYDVDVISESPLPSSEPVHIALALDVTGSMGYSSKLDTLKIAAKDLVDTLASYQNDSVKISVVPFSQYVNVGLAQRGQAWLDVNADWAEPQPDNCRNVTPVIGKTNCRMEGYGPTPPTPPTPAGTCYNDGVAYPCGGSSGSPGSPGGSHEVCDNVYGPTEWVCTPRADIQHVWSGCVGSRLNPWHERVNYTAGKKIPGLMDETHCNQEVLPLTNNYPNVKTRIDSLTAVNNTYIPAGVMWGWRTLNPQLPFSEASSANMAKTKSVMILMTDGSNTLSKIDITHEGSDTVATDTLTTQLCDNVKADNITIYSIAYEITDVTTRNMIQGCATDPSGYYDASNAAALKAAFEDIGANLIRLRLTH